MSLEKIAKERDDALGQMAQDVLNTQPAPSQESDEYTLNQLRQLFELTQHQMQKKADEMLKAKLWSRRKVQVAAGGKPTWAYKKIPKRKTKKTNT